MGNLSPRRAKMSLLPAVCCPVGLRRLWGRPGLRDAGDWAFGPHSGREAQVAVLRDGEIRLCDASSCLE